VIERDDSLQKLTDAELARRVELIRMEVSMRATYNAKGERKERLDKAEMYLNVAIAKLAPI
jgi:hypothetical protein